MVGCSGYPYVGSSTDNEEENERESERIRVFLAVLCLDREAGGTGHGASSMEEMFSGGTSVRIGLVVVTGSEVGGIGGGNAGLGGISSTGGDEGGE